MKTTHSPLTILLTICLLTACGGGGGGGDAPDDSGNGGGVAVPTLSIADTTLTEGDSGTATLEFAVSLSAATTNEVSVDFTTEDTEADASDYTPTSGTLRFSAGATSASIDIPVTGDTTIERDERLRVQLSNPQTATLADDVGEGTIANDDFSLLSIESVSQPEGDTGVTAMRFTISLDRPGIDAVTVDYAASDAAAQTGSDYTAVTGSLQLDAGEVSASVDITIIGDTDIEADEQFVVNLLNPSPNARIAVDEATGLIINDDFAKVSIGPGGITESDANSRTLALPISLDSPSPEDVIVSYVTEDVTATAGEDYVAANASIVIAAGDTSATVALEVIGDTLPEPVEVMLDTLPEVDGAAIIDQSLALATIIDNDGQNLEPSLLLQPAGITEGDTGTTAMQFLFLLTEPLSEDFSFDVATAAVSATAGVDYTDVATRISIPAGDQSALLPVTSLNDTDEEPDESFSLTVTNLSSAVVLPATTVLGTIADNDSDATDPLPRLSVSDAEIVEGDSGTRDLTFIITLDGPSATDITIDFATEDGSALAGVDYVAVDGQISIPAGSLVANASVEVIGDTFSEDDETLRLRLSNLTGEASLDRVLGIGVILTDEPLVRLSLADASGQEGDDTDTEQRFVVSLDMPAENAVSFEFATTDDSAIAGEDYVSNTGASQILAGESSAEIVVAIIADTNNEPDETYTMTLSNVSTNAVVQRNVATGTIVNDDGTPGWQAPTTLGGRFDYHSVAMHPDGNGAAVLVGATDPATFTNPILVARFSGGAWLAPEPTGGSTSIGFALDPRITMLDNDRILASWPTRVDVQSALYDSTQNWVLQSVANEQGFFVALDSNSGGDATLAFESNGNNSDPRDILRNQWSSTTGDWEGATLAESDDTGDAREPSVVINDAGDRLIFWFQAFNDSSLTGNYYDFYSSATDSWTGPTFLTELPFSNNEYLGKLRDGRFAIATQSEAGGVDRVELWMFDPVSLSWTTTGTIQASATEDAVLPKFSQAGDGTIFIAWFQEPQSAVYDVYANRYDPVTETWGTPVVLENLTGSANPLDSGLDIASDDAGNAIVVWSQNIAETGQFDSRIRASRFEIDTGEWTPPEQIDDDDVNAPAIEPHIGMDSAGNAIVIWYYDQIFEYGATHFIAP